MKRIYSPRDFGFETYETVTFQKGRHLSTVLADDVNGSIQLRDLVQNEVALRAVHNDFKNCVNRYSLLATESQQLIPKDRFEGPTGFDEHHLIVENSAILLRSQAERLFLHWLTYASGIEDRVVRLSLRLKQVSNGQIWPQLPSGAIDIRNYIFNVVSDRLGAVAPEGDLMLKLRSHRDRSIHERHHFAHLVEVDGKRDVIFSPAMNACELAEGSLPQVSITQISGSVRVLVDQYLATWCVLGVEQMGADPGALV